MPFTSLLMRVETRSRKLMSKGKKSAVMPSTEVTARKASMWSWLAPSPAARPPAPPKWVKEPLPVFLPAPIFASEPVDAAEFAEISRDHDQAAAAGMARAQEIISADR